MKEAARPLLILWPFGPVALVYDILDTEGEALPKDVASFFARGSIDNQKIDSLKLRLRRTSIEWYELDAGDGNAGWLRVSLRSKNPKEATLYRMAVNRNHASAVQFATLAHELGHLFLGHLGGDKALNVPDRAATDQDRQELEAESVSYLVGKSNGVTSKSETYLASYVEQHTTLNHVDMYQIMRAAGQVETMLGLTAHTDSTGQPENQFHRGNDG